MLTDNPKHVHVILSGWLLIQTQNISRWILEPCRYLGRIGANRLHDYAPIGGNLFDRGRYTVNHDVDEQSDLTHRLSTKHPSPANFTDPIVESDRAISARSQFPPEDCLIKIRRPLNIGSRNFDVANLAVGKCWLFVVAHELYRCLNPGAVAMGSSRSTYDPVATAPGSDTYGSCSVLTIQGMP
jgi:hypothetical protein